MVILFIDLDGTLIVEEVTASESGGAIDLKGQMLQILQTHKFPAVLIDRLTSVHRTTLLWNGVMDLLEDLELEPQQVSCIRNELDVVLATYEQAYHESSSLTKDAIAFLKGINQDRFTRILLTNTSRFELEKIFSKYDLSKYFQGSITRDDVKKIKPDPEGIQKILDKHEEDQFVVIDDLDYGVLATHAAQDLGYKGFSILVNRGRYNTKQLSELNPDAIVSSLLEIPPVLEQWANSS